MMEREGIKEVTKPRYERVHGRYERIELFSNQFVKLAQIRGERNTVSEELKADIVHQGLINPVDVVRIDESLLVDYIDFVNRVWSSSSVLDDFSTQRNEDGTYHLLVAGYSRHLAIEEAEDEGLMARYPIEAKVHSAESIWDIVTIQSSENIHSTPPKERRAIALVEAYELGLAEGRWTNQQEYIDSTEGNETTMHALQEAQSFSRLPPRVRNLVFDGTIPFSAGVQIGRSVGVIREYLAVQYYGGERSAKVKGSVYSHIMESGRFADATKEQIDLNVSIELWNLAAGILRDEKRRSVIGAERFVVGQRKQWRDFTKLIKNPEGTVPGITLEYTPDMTFLNSQRRLKSSLHSLARVPGSRISSIIAESGWLISEPELDILRAELQQTNQRAQRSIGDVSARHSGLIDPSVTLL